MLERVVRRREWGEEGCRKGGGGRGSAFSCLLLQALDEEYLKVDAQFGGVDQRKIFTFAEKVSSCEDSSLY